jgi:hypothetical protein
VTPFTRLQRNLDHVSSGAVVLYNQDGWSHTVAAIDARVNADTLRRVELCTGNLDKMSQVLVERLTAGDQHLSIQQHGHGFTDA